jgi:hypothetical protein
MLQMATEWSDLESVALTSCDRDLSTPYWSSTLEIGRQVIQKLSAIFTELGPEGTSDFQDHRSPQQHRLSERSAERAREILAASPLAATLLRA